MLEAMVGTRLCSGLQCEKFNVQKFVSRVVLVVSPFLVHVRLSFCFSAVNLFFWLPIALFSCMSCFSFFLFQTLVNLISRLFNGK